MLQLETQHPQALWRVRFIEAAYAQMLGRFDEAEMIGLEALALGQKKDEVVPAQGFVSFMFVHRYLQGRLAEVEGAFQGQAAQYPDSLLYRASGMFLHLTLGRTEQAREEFERFAILGEEELDLAGRFHPSQIDLDRPVRTCDSAKAAPDTSTRVCYHRIKIAFCIERLAHRNYFLRTCIIAQLAAFALVFMDLDHRHICHL